MTIKELQDIIEKGESQFVEFKRLWKDEYLKTLCAFANTSGGKLLIGIEDNKKIAQLPDTKKLLEVLPNKISNKLGIIPEIYTETINNEEIIVIEIKKSFAPISYNGKFYARSGSISTELSGTQLMQFLLKKYGKTWDDIAIENFSISEIENETIEKFKILATDRIPGIRNENDTETLLRKLNLYDGDYLKRAAVLLFAKNPQKYFIQSHSKIGRFLSETDILTSDIIEGNLINQVDTILNILRTKYLKSIISFEGIHRREKLEYPYDALKEAVINALIHRDYLNTSNLQIKVYDNKITMTNGATLPPEITIEKLKQAHPSVPGNPIIAAVFYKAGLIENWGRGTINIVNYCIDYKIPEPKFDFDAGIFWTTFFKKDNDTDNDTNNDTDNDTNDTDNDTDKRTVNILKLIDLNKNISSSQLAIKCNVSVSTIKRELKKLKQQNKLKRIGSEKSGYWEIIENT